MRWIWKLAMFLVIIVLAKNLLSDNKPKAFIDFQNGISWEDRISGQLRIWQQQIQDLPASIETQIKQLWQDFQPDDHGKIV